MYPKEFDELYSKAIAYQSSLPPTQHTSIEYVQRNPDKSANQVKDHITANARAFHQAVEHLSSDMESIHQLVVGILMRMNNHSQLTYSTPRIFESETDLPQLDEKFSFMLTNQSYQARREIRRSSATLSIFSIEEIAHSLQVTIRDQTILHAPDIYFFFFLLVFEGLQNRARTENTTAEYPIFSHLFADTWGHQTTISRFVVPALCVCAKALKTDDCFREDVRASAIELLVRSGAFEKRGTVQENEVVIRCPAQQFVTKVLQSDVLPTIQHILRGKQVSNDRSTTSNSGTIHSSDR